MEEVLNAKRVQTELPCLLVALGESCYVTCSGVANAVDSMLSYRVFEHGEKGALLLNRKRNTEPGWSVKLIRIPYLDDCFQEIQGAEGNI